MLIWIFCVFVHFGQQQVTMAKNTSIKMINLENKSADKFDRAGSLGLKLAEKSDYSSFYVENQVKNAFRIKYWYLTITNVSLFFIPEKQTWTQVNMSAEFDVVMVFPQPCDVKPRLNECSACFFWWHKCIFTSVAVCLIVSHPFMDADGCFTPNNPTQCAGVNTYIVWLSCSPHKGIVGVL